jgi:prolyl oligopeptidase
MLRQFVMAVQKVFVLSQNGSHSSIQSWSHRGEELPVFDLPPDETVGLFPDLGDGNSIFLSCESFTRPPDIFEYIPARSELSVWHESSPHCALTDFTVRRATYSSVDGAEIPITLVGYQASSDSKSPVPVIMTSYGGFGVPMTPQFSVLVALMLARGAIFAIPHIRGGGEFGKAWHNAGRRRNRQTSFDDFFAAAEWLCRAGITSPSQLAIFGGSNSGLLVGVAMTQRPELFRAVLCIAPLLDMIRYEHFDQAMKWREEYGSCESTEDFQALYAYSPYHRIQDNTKYPVVLFVVGDKDDRCNPLHVRKMAARLLENSAQANPVLVDYSDERGHSPVLPLNVRIDALAHRIAFLCRELNLPFADGACYGTACARELAAAALLRVRHAFPGLQGDISVSP